MRQRLACLILIAVFSVTMSAGIELPGVYNPAQLVVAPDKTVLVFDRAAGLLVYKPGASQPLKIGAFGQGPGEYGKSAFICTREGKIFLSTRGKVVVYDYQGNVARELRHNLDLFRHRLVPLPESGWLADMAETDYSPHGGTIIRACLLNSDISIGKELYRRKVPLPMREVRLFPFAAGSEMTEKNIVTAAAEDNGSLRIYDLQGKSAAAIVIPQSQWREPVKDEIAARMEEYRKRAGDPAFWKELKRRITIPGHIPNLLDFRASEDGILVRTPDTRDNKRVFLFFDFSGKRIKDFLLPDAGPLYDFSNNAYHYLETPDENNTLLHTLPLLRRQSP